MNKQIKIKLIRLENFFDLYSTLNDLVVSKDNIQKKHSY